MREFGSYLKQGFENKKVLVTGHTGFKGAWFCALLIKLGAQIVGVSKSEDERLSLFSLLKIDSENSLKSIYVDISESSKVIEIIKEEAPDYVFHFAAQALVGLSYSEPVETFSTNVLGTVNVLEGIRLLNKECIGVFITTDKCYENKEWIWGYRENDRLGGHDPYSASKSAAEMVIQSYFRSFFKNSEGLKKVISVRAGNIIGGGDFAKDRLIPDCYRAWVEGKQVVVRSPNAVRPWQFVLDPLVGYLVASLQLKKNGKLNGEAFNLGPKEGQSSTVLEVLKGVSRNWNDGDRDKDYYTIGDAEFKESSLLSLNVQKAKSYLGWESVLNLEEAIEWTAHWYKVYYREKDKIAGFTTNQIEEYWKRINE